MSIAKDIITHPEYIRKLRQKGGEAMAAKVAAENDVPVDAGLFDYPDWEAGKEYKTIGELFVYDGKVGFIRSVHTSMAHYPPFSVGTEAQYGARPRQLPDGTYPYVYNMKVEAGMRVRSEKDGAVYLCYNENGADPLLYDPADVPAIFEKEAE